MASKQQASDAQAGTTSPPPKLGGKIPGLGGKDAAAAELDMSALAEKEAAALANSKRNEIKEIRNYKQLDKVDLDYDSPRLKQAMYNLGVSKEECMKK